MATILATTRGPLELACRDAGLLPCAESIQYLEDLALRLKMAPRSGLLTPKHLRAAARFHRKSIERGAKWAHKSSVPAKPVKDANGKMVEVERDPGTTRTSELGSAKAFVKREKGLTSGRQWKKWKKEEQRRMRAEIRAEQEAARGH